MELSDFERRVLNRSLDGMRGIVKAVSQILLMVLAAVYAQGLIFNALWGIFAWLGGKDIPGPWWWYATVGALITGAVALVLEAVGTFLVGGFTFGDNASTARKNVGVAMLVLLLVTLLIGWPLYHISQQ